MESTRPSIRSRSTRIRRVLGLVVLVLLVAGCSSDDRSSDNRSSATPAVTERPMEERPKAEVEFLAQYEKLRTQACPISSKPCTSPSRPSQAAKDALETCITQALTTIPQLPPDSNLSKDQVDAQLARNTATVQSRIRRCTERHGGAGTLGYGRAYGHGSGMDANVTGSPVDVVIH